ncbi:SIS domain-containing protein [Aestuariimicrobium kwangyangense]|uniref:SIS domain-containing protein n=1 Tax=Aestuariimicrobium kwangyangense TaxID=396389 RepID=UPI0003B58027|nr:SIS domain-containing protein [Aestuariimicrobium kwangyangense]
MSAGDFDDSLLEQTRLSERADDLLRSLASAGSRVRREAQGSADEPLAAGFEAGLRPRGVIAVGPEARLIRALLEPVCPVPFMAWPHPGLPAWVGALDLVVVLAPSGSDPALVASVAEAVRRGAAVVVAAQPGSAIAERAGSRTTLLLPVTTGDALACVVQVLSVLHQLGLGPLVVPEQVADAADLVAEESSPHRDLTTNPAKELAVALADAQPLVWGGTVLAARASRRVAEAIRRSSGRAALAADASELLPVIEGVRERDVFADPLEDGEETRPVLVVLDDPAGDAQVRQERSQLLAAAQTHDVRVCVVEAGSEMTQTSSMETYVTLLQKGLFGAAWLGIGLGAF